MSESETHRLIQLFHLMTGHDTSIVTRFTDDLDAVLQEAEQNLTVMLPDLAYRDQPDHVMAGNLYFCAIQLAVYLPLKSRGVGVHDYGTAMLDLIRQMNRVEPAPDSAPTALVRAARESESREGTGEFVFEVVPGSGESFDYGMNIKSCAICHLFMQYDAMDLVPYMCASDDVVSDISGQGLSRSGTIALGKHQCDFRFKAGETGQALADRYPERIRTTQG